MRTLFQQAPLQAGELCEKQQARVVLLESDAEKESLLTLFEAIAKEQGWQPGQELRAYPHSAIYFALMMDEQMVGGLQLVVGQRSRKALSLKKAGGDLATGSQQLPFLTVWPELVSQAKAAKHCGIADIALLALRSEYRGQRDLFWLLCIEMWRYCTEHRITTLWVEVTPAKLQLYRRLGWPLQIAGPLRLHWGEECYPCWMSTESVAQALSEKACRSTHYQHLLNQAYRKEPLNVQKLNVQKRGKDSTESDFSGSNGNSGELNHQAGTTQTQSTAQGTTLTNGSVGITLPFVA